MTRLFKLIDFKFQKPRYYVFDLTRFYKRHLTARHGVS
jgi:hypothetical protein